MLSLRERVDASSITVTFLPLPKRKKRGSAMAFCAGDPVASVEGAGHYPPFRWIDGTPQEITFQDLRKLSARGGSASQLAGFWTTPKGAERAVVWTRRADGGLTGAELHPGKWEKSMALACGDGQQIGFGYEVFVRNPSKALLWSGSRDSVVVLTGPDPSVDATGSGVADGVQVGTVGGSMRKHACLWRGTAASHVDLHPTSEELFGSEALGVGDGQQVGQVWNAELESRAALWSGSAGSYVNLAPDGFVRSRATICRRGFQAGWVCREDRGMLIRAVLWGGAAEDYVDLQDSLPAPWNASWVMALDVDGDRLRILGTAQQAVKSGSYEMNAGEQPVIWEMKLLVPEPAARRELPAEVTTEGAGAAPEEVTEEQRVQKVGADFAQAVIDGDFKTAHALLAPWLRKQVTAKKLQSILDKERLADLELMDFAMSGNDSTLEELRSHYAEYHDDDPDLTLATAEEFGAYGPPSIHIPNEVTPENFRQWMSLEFTPDPDNEAGLDYCLKVWVIVVESDGVMRIGHLKPGE
jgi:hypothetical protein